MKRYARSLNSALWERVYALVFLIAVVNVTLPAQTFKTVIYFDGSNGNTPEAPLVQGTNGSLYGTTFYDNNVFQLSPKGLISYSLCNSAQCIGGDPTAGLVQAANGDFYGTSETSATPNPGTVFKMTPSGSFALVHSFDLSDGVDPGALLQAANGDLYGITAAAGGNGNGGTVFRLTLSGNFTTLYNFCSKPSCADGAGPAVGLIQANDGNFYGTTEQGGATNCFNQYGCGTVFKITPAGDLTTIHKFCLQTGCPDGATPLAGLIQGANGDLYGATSLAGANNGGTLFKITLNGSLTTLYSFCSQSQCTDGEAPNGGLIHATDGNFYGTTTAGGLGYGTIFRITPTGTLTTLHSFSLSDGESPVASLVQATSGVMYGTTPSGGPVSVGTVFSLSVGLPPFVETQVTAGKVGASVNILGNNLIGATSVTFNGVQATFTVPASTVIKATVPSGATTGNIEVITPNGTLSSNAAFIVLP